MRRRRYGVVPLPPVPENPAICRWCTRTLQTYEDGERFCASGCSPNDQPLYSGQCTDCERSFETGDKWATTLCWQCVARETHAQRADVPHEPPFRTFSKPAMRERLGVSGNVDE